MKRQARWLVLLPLFWGCAACNTSDAREEGAVTADTAEATPVAAPADSGRGGGRAGGTLRTGGAGDREVFDLSVNAPTSEGSEPGRGGVVMVWIGDFPCPPPVGTPPTYDSNGLVALPWRPGLDVVLSEEVMADGEFTIYTLFAQLGEDGCWTFFECCQVVRVDAGGERDVDFEAELQRVEHGAMRFEQLGANCQPLRAGDSNDEVLLIIKRRL
jgi:hypothetical protein